MKPYINTDSRTLYLNRVLNHHLLLKKNKSLEGKEMNIFITKVNEDIEKDLDSYNTAKQNKNYEEMKKYLVKYFNFPFNLDDIILYGNANQRYKSYIKFEGLLDRIVRKDSSSEIITAKRTQIYYRNYEQRQETWEETCAYLNPCPEFKMSWQSALRKLGARWIKGLNNTYQPFYVIVWYNDMSIEELKKAFKL